MRYYGSYRSSPDYKGIAMVVALCLLGALFIGWIIAEFCCTRTFVGTLVSREAPITFTYDEERLSINSEGELETSGDDETIAYKRYLLTFYADGDMRTVTAGTSRGRTPRVRREDLALAALAANDVEPPIYTYGKVNVEYIVKVSGWLLDGTVEDMTPMSSVKVE
jgi:hypothetical protein